MKEYITALEIQPDFKAKLKKIEKKGSIKKFFQNDKTKEIAYYHENIGLVTIMCKSASIDILNVLFNPVKERELNEQIIIVKNDEVGSYCSFDIFDITELKILLDLQTLDTSELLDVIDTYEEEVSHVEATVEPIYGVSNSQLSIDMKIKNPLEFNIGRAKVYFFDKSSMKSSIHRNAVKVSYHLGAILDSADEDLLENMDRIAIIDQFEIDGFYTNKGLLELKSLEEITNYLYSVHQVDFLIINLEGLMFHLATEIGVNESMHCMREVLKDKYQFLSIDDASSVIYKVIEDVTEIEMDGLIINELFTNNKDSKSKNAIIAVSSEAGGEHDVTPIPEDVLFLEGSEYNSTIRPFIIKEMMMKGSIPVYHQFDFGNTALMYAIHHNDLGLLDGILKKMKVTKVDLGAVDVCNEYKLSALQIAIRNENHRAIQLLVSFGFSVKENPHAAMPVDAFTFATYLKKYHTLNHLINTCKQEGIEVKEELNWALCHAVLQNQIEEVQLLIENGADPNWKVPGSVTIREIALGSKSKNLIKAIDNTKNIMDNVF